MASGEVGEVRGVPGFWRRPEAPGRAGSDRTGCRAEGVPTTSNGAGCPLQLCSPQRVGQATPLELGWCLVGELQEGVRGSPQSPVLPPALVPSSPAHSCPSFAPCATDQTCTSPGWRLGGGTRSHSADGCPWVGWTEEGDPHVKELKAPGPRVRALDRSQGAQLGTRITWGQRGPQCAHLSNGKRWFACDGQGADVGQPDSL